MPLDRWDRLAGRLVMAPPAGKDLTDRERTILERGEVRHLILFARHLREEKGAAGLIAECRTLVAGRPLVAVDHEGGLVSFASRLVGAAPSARLLGSIGDPAYAGEWAEAQATALRSFGFNMVNAPVLDVAGPGGSPVIGTRSYGRESVDVARMGEAAMSGYLRGGIIPVIKHFPGHGGVSGDSHVVLPVDRRTGAAIRARDIAPFQRCVEKGAPVVMAAHVAFPRLTGSGNLPASASPLILQEILRGDLRFRGVVMSDAFDMRGYGGKRFASDSLRAGIDLFCCGSTLAAGARFAGELARALRAGEVDRQLVVEKAAAIDDLMKIPGRRRKVVPPPTGREGEGIVWEGEGAFTPPAGNWHLFLPRGLAGRLKAPLLLDEVRRRWGASWRRRRITLFPADPDRGAINGLREKARQYDMVVLGLLGRGELPPGQQHLARALKRGGRKVLPVGLLDSQPVRRLCPAGALYTFDFRPATIAALVEMLAGEKRPEAKLP